MRRDIIPDSLIFDFAKDVCRDPSALGRYCLRYPTLTPELIALAHELAIQRDISTDAPLDTATQKWIEIAIENMRGAANPFAKLTGTTYVQLRERLNVPSIVINAFRDRLVAVATVPFGFLEQLAEGLGEELRVLANYLTGAPKLALGVQYKSAVNPAASNEKMSFADLLNEAGVAPERQAALLTDDM